MKARLICLVRRHQWHNGWDEDRHQTVWTCKRCGATRRSDELGEPSPDGLRPLCGHMKGSHSYVPGRPTRIGYTEPQAALMAGEFAVHLRNGDVYSVEEVRGWLDRTGWRFADHRLLAGPHSLIVAEAA
jgi:hypothetical protein